jgi:hypothetical protein|tara:strand:+ start:476 stop:649 length:174 start_codon:yes stop_codon:yes gene_type:complete
MEPERGSLMMEKTPVHEHEGRWYFWDEVWANRHGPFKSEEEAAGQCKRYLDWLNNGE